tara:strand:- start:2467 stop:3483 length:1017 start_codon:yes stop_codon:yes gene_type:complete
MVETATTLTAIVSGYADAKAAVYSHDDAAATVNVTRVTPELTIPQGNSGSGSPQTKTVTFDEITLSPDKFYSIAVKDGAYYYCSGSTDRYEDPADTLPATWTDTTRESSYTDAPAVWIETVASTHSIPAADDITDESQPATLTLSGNENAPTGITINGEAGSNITFVSENAGAGTETYSYEPPLIADDDTADLVVSVDGTTASTTIAYANSYDRDQLTHPATEAEYSENSLSYPNAYATTQPYEWKVITDANASVVTIDWDALEADDGFHKDVASYATPVANGVTTVTLGVFVPETGQAYQFDRTITVSDGSVVVEGKGLFRSLFSALEKSLFKPLFR